MTEPGLYTFSAWYCTFNEAEERRKHIGNKVVPYWWPYTKLHTNMREVIPLLWVGAMALENQLVKSHWKLVATKGNPILGINRGDSWHLVSRHWLCSAK